jgi:peptidoglycan-associated lipoprotein
MPIRSAVAVSLFALSVGLAAASVACNHDQPPPAPPPAPAPSSAPTVSSAPSQKQDPAINLSKDIVDACNITASDKAPKFDFDSSDLSSAEKDVLGQVATCLTTGPLKGKSVKLVGRADPRGEQEYNMELGENRAHAVKKYLGGLGVDGGRMQLSSRGALDATGHDESTWKLDRRVDISLK